MRVLDDTVIAALYGAVDVEARWVDFMDLMRRHLRVECAAAQLLAVSHDDLLPVWGTRDRLSESRAALHDSWANSLANPRFRRPVGPSRELEIDSDQRTPDYSAEDRRVLRDGLARCGLGPAFWISQQIDRDHHFTMIFHRAADDGRDMDAGERHMLEALAPHFRQAVRLWMRLAAAEARADLVEQAAEGRMTAMVACDRHMRVHWLNADARRLLNPGTGLRLRDGHLACARRDHDRLLALVGGRSDRAVMAIGDDRGPVFHVRARPSVPGPIALARDLVLLVITRPDCPVRYDPGDIALLFGLTATEAMLAASLAAGASVSEFAAARGVAEGTARLHLKRVLAKTGTGRQSELVRRICLSVAESPF
jgi:DNA-binding CsgD family transcriptional regulator